MDVTSVHEEKKAFKCDICDYSCSQKSNMNKHVKSVHAGKKPLKCDMCEFSCSQRSSVNRHVERRN